MDKVDCIVVGAGVVGLAIGRALAMAGREVILLEAEATFGSATSSRNSEVIHAGIYYPKGSLKAQFCVRGRDLLYDYCQKYGVNHSRVGKFVVATEDDQVEILKAIEKAAIANGVYDLVMCSKAEVAAAEPEVKCQAALFSPSTGIIDSQDYMRRLLGDIEANGGWLARSAPVVAIAARPEGGFVLSVGGESPMDLACDVLINSAGLKAGEIAKLCYPWGSKQFPKIYYAKGNYFSLSVKSPFHHLIYPVPVPGGLGTHATLDLGGQVRFGPDVEWIDALDYAVDPKRVTQFYPAVRAFWPNLPADALTPAYCGIRPKISAPGEPAADFLILDQTQHGVPGLVHLAGIESPGLTSSLAIAERVVGSIISAPH
jgi:L-2-hydroxyglutarate oxidase LhgO